MSVSGTKAQYMRPSVWRTSWLIPLIVNGIAVTLTPLATGDLGVRRSPVPGGGLNS